MHVLAVSLDCRYGGCGAFRGSEKRLLAKQTQGGSGAMQAQPITAQPKWMSRKDPKSQVLNTTSAFPSCLPDADFALENQWLGSGGGWVGGMIWPRSMVHSLYFCLPPLSLALENPSSAIRCVFYCLSTWFSNSFKYTGSSFILNDLSSRNLFLETNE